jgi:hypothetical protein
MKETMTTIRRMRWTFDTVDEAVKFASLKLEEGCDGVETKPLTVTMDGLPKVVGVSVYWNEESTD